MVRAWPVIAISILAGCPPKPGGGGPTPNLGSGAVAAGPGCPTATAVHVASYVSPEERSPSPPPAGAPAKPSHAGWVLPLFDRVVDSLDGIAEFATIDAATATAAGVPAPPASAWMLQPGAAPCKLTIGSYYAAAIDAPTKNVAYGVQLSGCPAPPDPQTASAIVLATDASPTGCLLVGPRAVAMRLGEYDKSDHWQRPTKQTPIPPALAAVIPQHACTAPACESLWSIAQVDVGGKPVAWAGAVNWLETAGDEPCSWKAERFSGFFIAGPDGSPVRVTEGQDHPLALTAVLADRGGAKVLVAEGPGEYATFALGGGAATVANHLVWLRPDPVSYENLDNLGPVCGGLVGTESTPPAPAPAPAPSP